MTPAIFKCERSLIDGTFLAGRYRWASDMRLVQALVTCRPPLSGALELVLLVDGVAQGGVTVPAARLPELVLAKALDVLVTAGATVSWRVSFSGSPEEAASALALTLLTVPQSVSQVTVPLASLTLEYASGTGRQRLSTYDPGTKGFSPSPDPTLIQVVQDGSFQTGINSVRFYLVGQEVLRVASGVVRVRKLVEGCQPITARVPALRFCIGGVPGAVASTEWFWVPTFTETR